MLQQVVQWPRGYGAKGVRAWRVVILLSALEIADNSQARVHCEGDSPLHAFQLDFLAHSQRFNRGAQPSRVAVLYSF